MDKYSTGLEQQQEVEQQEAGWTSWWTVSDLLVPSGQVLHWSVAAAGSASGAAGAEWTSWWTGSDLLVPSGQVLHRSGAAGSLGPAGAAG